MSEVTTALKIGTTLLVLEMIEAGEKLPDFEIANEIRSIRDSARFLRYPARDFALRRNCDPIGDSTGATRGGVEMASEAA